MSDSTLDRHTFHRTRHRGFTFRYRADGSKIFYGYIPGRGRVQLRAPTFSAALEEWAELRGKGKHARLPNRKVTFAEVAEAWYESKTSGKRPLRRSTRELYRSALDNYILPRFAAWKVADIEADAIVSVIRKMEEAGLSRSSVENYILPLKGSLDLAVRRGLLPANPYDLLTVDERPQADEDAPDDEGDVGKAYEWSDEEIEKLLNASARRGRQPEARYDYSPLLRVAVRTGLRLGELLGLQWRDVDLEASVLHVKRQWTKYGELTAPKTKRARRRVPLAAEDLSFLKALKVKALARGLAGPDNFVFCSRARTPLMHRNVQRRGFEAARDAAELPKRLTFHSLRHAFASYAAHRGVPVNVLSQVMGHSNVGVTQRVYIHLYGREQVEDDFRRAMGRAQS